MPTARGESAALTVLVHTAARDASDPGFELTALWLGVVKSLAN